MQWISTIIHCASDCGKHCNTGIILYVYRVIVAPVFHPIDVMQSDALILRKSLEITLDKFEKVKEELYRELGVQAGGLK